MLAAPPSPSGDLEEGRSGLDESTVSLADRARQAAVRPGLMVSMCEEDKGRDLQRQPLPTALLAGPGPRLASGEAGLPAGPQA